MRRWSRVAIFVLVAGGWAYLGLRGHGERAWVAAGLAVLSVGAAVEQAWRIWRQDG